MSNITSHFIDNFWTRYSIISDSVISQQNMNVTVADRNTSFTLYFEDIKFLNKDFEQTTFNIVMVTVNITSILAVNSLVLIWLKSKVCARGDMSNFLHRTQGHFAV